MFSKPADLITAWLIAGVMLLSIAIAPFAQLRDPPSERPGAVREIATQKFDVKKSGPAVMPSAAALASNERAPNDESQRDRRNTTRVSLQR